MPEDVKKVAVVILNWNGLKLLKHFLPTVVEHSSPVGKVYVIDNNSSDQSREWVQEKFPEVGLIELPANYGYAGGYNRGLEYIKEAYAVLLNSDVEVTRGWLEPLIKRFENNKRLAALQPKIKDLKHRSYFEYAGAAGGFVDNLAYPFCRGRIFETLEKDEGQYDTYRKIFWASGACLMVDQEKYRNAGRLYESLFAHMEEIDLCWRMQLKGYEIACEPQSVVYHLGGATLNKLSPHKTYLNFRNSLIIMFLNLPGSEAFSKIMARLLLDGIAGIRFLLQGKLSHTTAIIKAHFAFYSRFTDLSKKKLNMPSKPLSSLEGVYSQSIIKQYFLSRSKKFSQLKK